MLTATRTAALTGALTVTLSQARAQAGRLVAASVAIILSVAFVTTTLALSATLERTVLDTVAAEVATADVVVRPVEGAEPAAAQAGASLLAAVRGTDGIAVAEGTATTFVDVGYGPDRRAGFGRVTSVAAAKPLRWQEPAYGRLPAAEGEVALDARTAEREGVSSGSLVDIGLLDGATRRVEVVGTVDVGSSPRYAGGTTLFATVAQVQAWSPSEESVSEESVSEASVNGSSYDTVLAVGEEGTAPAQLALEVSSALAAAGLEAQVLTAEEEASAQAAELTGDTDVLTAGLLGFATIALLVAAIVIANTFAVLVAQRTRALALLRCVGATGSQVRRSVLVEAGVLGLLASVAGVAVGLGLSAVASEVVAAMDLPVPLRGVAVTPATVWVGVVVGTAVTVGAAVLPARRATRVSPLAALHPVDTPPVRSRAGVVRLGLSGLLVLAGTAGLVLGALGGSLPLGLAGGVASFLGVLLGSTLLVPAAVGAVGRLLTPLGGVPAQLAAGNAVRDPGRTAATGAALLVGVTLVTLMTVGASSSRATLTSELAAQFPTDVTVISDSPLTDATLQRLAAVPDVAATATLVNADVTGPGAEPILVEAVDPAQAQAVRRSPGRESLLENGTAVVSEAFAVHLGLSPGEPLVLSTGTGQLELAVARGGEGDVVLLTQADLSVLAPGAATTVVELRLGDAVAQDDDAAREALTAIEDSVAQENVYVQGALVERVSYDAVIDSVLIVVLALLATAVLIALVGVANTLALSVVERRRESALLRALGLTRGQLRAMLAVEAALVAGVSALLGVVLGIGYGLAGTFTVLESLGPVVVDVPVQRLVLVVLVAVVAGLVASVLPGRRAARTAPAAALVG